MQSEHRAYEKAFKMEAVRLVQTSGKSISQVAKDLGIPDGNLSRWCRQQEERGEQAFVGSGHQTAQARGTASPETGA
jgi:transposase